MKYVNYILFFFMFCTVARSQDPPELSATGNQPFCPLNEIYIVTDFSIDNPDNEEINNVYIQISEGYVNGEDDLFLTGNHPNITAESFNNLQGKLVLNWTGAGTPMDSEIIDAVKGVKFYSSSNNPSDKSFSITIGTANYLPSTGHYYEYVPDIGITWSNAKTLAGSRTYYGLQGYLATITSEEEAVLSGEQAAGAGWIGGSDEDVEGTWRWKTGPEAGKSFWFGGITGTTVGTDLPYALWNTSEPNSYQGRNEDYAHVTDPDVGNRGSWNDLTNTGDFTGKFQPQGYIMEYGGMTGDPILNISASTSIYVSLPITPNINTNSPICSGSNALFTITGTAGDIVTYSGDASGTATIESSGTVIIELLNAQSDATVNLTNVNNGNCDLPLMVSKTITVNSIPITPNIKTNSPVCYGENAVFTIEGTASDVVTYSGDASGTATINASGTVDVTLTSVTSNVTLNLTNTTNGNCDLILTESATISVNSLPVAPTLSTNSPICSSSNAVFTITGTAGDIVTYSGDASGTATIDASGIVDVTISNVTVDVVLNLTNNNNGNCDLALVESATISINPIPSIDNTYPNTRCDSGTVLLEASSSTGTINWYDSQTGGTLLGTGESFTTPILSITTPYWVEVTDGTCISAREEIIATVSEKPTITLSDIEIEDISNNNTITISNVSGLGIGDYVFSIDGGVTFEDVPVFTNVSAGFHTIIVNDLNGCGSTSIKVSVVGYSKFFSPNGDGQNDLWSVDGFDPGIYSSIIYIFDRYGILIKQLYNDQSWDGIIDGKVLPSSDYWYYGILTDTSGNIRQIKGHFSLLR